MPKSLQWRSLLIIGLPLIIVQAISIWVFYDRHVDTLTRRLAGQLAGELRLTLNHLRDFRKPADLVWILSEVQSNLDLRATYKRGETLGPIEHKGADTRVGAELIRVLKEYLSGPFIVDTETSDREIKIVIGLPSGVLEIITSMKKLRTVTTELVVMWSIGSSIVLLIIAALFMRNQVKPIRRLAHAADSFGKGRDVPDFKPSGAKEVRQASTAFIIMRERIKRQIQQRTEMLAGVSHDLRTPLTRMKLQLAMLDDDAAVEGLEADLAEMEQMVEEYLAFARGEGTEQAVETNLPTLLTDIIEGAQRNGHQVSLKTRGNLRATVRPNGIRRSLGNLITNAARFGDRIQVQAARKSGFVEITVDDNGPGVPEDKRDAVFTPFFRVDPSRNPESGGAGLGLTIARDIIRGHGGDIVLADSPLGGLRAVVRLPI
jgi:two-component system osmolarity sensor histidine kinase EnvZ